MAERLLEVATSPALRLLADRAPVMIWVSDTDGGFVWLNKLWLAFVGRTVAMEVGTGWVEAVHPEDRATCLRMYQTAIEGRSSFSAEFRMRRQDGHYRWALNKGSPHFDDAGALEGFVGSCVDITEQKRHELSAQASEATFRILCDGAPTMLWLSDAQGRCVHLNRRLREFWGISNEDLATFDWGATLHPEDAPHVAEAVRQSLETRERFAMEARYRDRTGQYRMLRTEAEPHYDTVGAFAGFIGVNVDVTVQLAMTSALERSEERFSRFMAHLPGLAWIKDADGRYVFANQAVAEAFGRPTDQLLGLSDAELFPPAIAAQFQKNDARVRASANGLRVIETLPHPDGLIHYSIVSKFATPEFEGVTGLVGGVAIDVTDQIAAEDRIKKLNEDLITDFRSVRRSSHLCRSVCSSPMTPTVPSSA